MSARRARRRFTLYFIRNFLTRRVGIFTMLKEIEYAIAAGKRYYYHGYAYEGESFYDYKKKFNAVEYFDWAGNWLSLEKETPGP